MGRTAGRTLSANRASSALPSSPQARVNASARCGRPRRCGCSRTSGRPSTRGAAGPAAPSRQHQGVHRAQRARHQQERPLHSRDLDQSRRLVGLASGVTGHRPRIAARVAGARVDAHPRVAPQLGDCVSPVAPVRSASHLDEDGGAPLAVAGEPQPVRAQIHQLAGRDLRRGGGRGPPARRAAWRSRTGERRAAPTRIQPSNEESSSSRPPSRRRGMPEGFGAPAEGRKVRPPPRPLAPPAGSPPPTSCSS